MKVSIIDNATFTNRGYFRVTQVSINVMPRVEELDMEEKTIVSIVRKDDVVRFDLTNGATITILEDL